MEYIVKVENLFKSFGQLKVLEGISFELFPGEILVILGGSGSGKSVLLQILVGLLPADKGRIWLHGQEVSRFKREEDWYAVRLKTGFLFQTGGLYDSMTIYENITFAMRYHLRLSEKEMQRRVKEILKAVHLEGVEDKYPAELSGGMQKRAALARAIALNPPLILYDEPTTGLDPIHSTMISHFIRHLQKTHNIASIVVTHDLECAYKVADRIMLLYKGNFVFRGTLQELKETDNPYIKQFLEGALEGPIQG
jgi:phospholipid/cholesterol/gamma-HCH transport system ATP-binding protein